MISLLVKGFNKFLGKTIKNSVDQKCFAYLLCFLMIITE